MATKFHCRSGTPIIITSRRVIFRNRRWPVPNRQQAGAEEGAPSLKGSVSMTILKRLRAGRLVSDTRGLTTVEYVIVLAMIAVMSVGLWNTFGTNISRYLTNSTTKIDTNMPPGVH
jgi:Flp pilus assembly pilin Flp